MTPREFEKLQMLEDALEGDLEEALLMIMRARTHLGFLKNEYSKAIPETLPSPPPEP